MSVAFFNYPGCNRETEFCNVVNAHPRVRAWFRTRDFRVGIPCRFGTRPGICIGDNDLLHLLIHIKSHHKNQASSPAPEVIQSRGGRWAVAEFNSMYTMRACPVPCTDGTVPARSPGPGRTMAGRSRGHPAGPCVHPSPPQCAPGLNMKWKTRIVQRQGARAAAGVQLTLVPELRAAPDSKNPHRGRGWTPDAR